MPPLEFSHPTALLLLLGLLPLLWGWARRRRQAAAFPSARMVAGVPAARTGWARWGGLALRGGALVFVIAALAGPRWPDAGSRVPAEGIAIGMVLDVSGTMAEKDFLWKDRETGNVQPVSRLEGVKRAFRLFVAGGTGPGDESLKGRAKDLISLVTFATRPETACPFTLSHSVLLKILDEQQPRSLPEEARTNIGDALGWALYRLRSAGPRHKVLILLTDGEHNVPPPALSPRQAAQLAGNLGVPVYVIDAGRDVEPGVPPRDETSSATRVAARKALQDVARLSNGHYFAAQDAAGLVDVYAQIDALEKDKMESFHYRRYQEAYPWAGLAALCLLATLAVLEATCWRVIP